MYTDLTAVSLNLLMPLSKPSFLPSMRSCHCADIRSRGFGVQSMAHVAHSVRKGVDTNQRNKGS